MAVSVSAEAGFTAAGGGGDANASRASTGPLASASVIESTHSRIIYTARDNFAAVHELHDI